MRILVHAVGRMKTGPGRELAAHYLDRFSKSGPAVGLELAGTSEQGESRAQTADQRKEEEARKLLPALEDGSALILLDERGKNLGSADFADALASLRDGGRRQVVIAIGGPDGHDPSLQARADLVLSFGKATWPHQMVRAMLAEQLYRAATILAGHPYHRS